MMKALLYAGSSLMSKIIMVKTWSDVSHIEIYIGKGKVVASRDGIGVDMFPFTSKGLKYVLEPKIEGDLDAAMRWFYTVRGQKYDWIGLLRFFTIGKQSLNKQFCSEFATRFYRAAGIEPFSPDYDADLVSPGMFKASPAFRQGAL